jgi:uncharacterized protein (TIGR00661 family)
MIPVIRYLKNQNITVIICCNQQNEFFFKEEFSDIKIAQLPGYQIKYAKDSRFFKWKILFQLPKIAFAILNERIWLKNAIKKYKADAVISDNRFGFYSNKVPSIFITHQLNIKTGHSFNDWVVRKLNYYFINKFDECWVPDFEINQLAGELSHPPQLPKIPVKYLGLLSRFQIGNESKHYKIAIVISGPEPQRSLFENILLKQLTKIKESVVFVRGLPGEKKQLFINNPFITIHNHLSSQELNKILLSAEIIIARSGYSTIMDLIALNKNAILIPTPKQTEQEYLAKYLHRKYFYCEEQEHFNIMNAVEAFQKMAFDQLVDCKINSEVVSKWLEKI